MFTCCGRSPSPPPLFLLNLPSFLLSWVLVDSLLPPSVLAHRSASLFDPLFPPLLLPYTYFHPLALVFTVTLLLTASLFALVFLHLLCFVIFSLSSTDLWFRSDTFKAKTHTRRQRVTQVSETQNITVYLTHIITQLNARAQVTAAT